MSTATSESLFIKKLDPNDLFEKEASIARMPDDDRKWPETVLSELHKQLPFMSGMDIALNFTRIQPQAGYGFGYAQVRGQINATGLQPKDENQMIKIPIVVSDRHLEPFHVFSFEGRTFPLTQSRFEEALENPRVFAGAAQTPKTQKSLIDQLYPPYQQRQGFGRTGEGAGMLGGAMGMGKTAKAIADMTPEEIQRLAELKRNEGLDKAQASLTKRDKRYALRDRLLASGLAGAATGMGVNQAVTMMQDAKRRGREKDRQSDTYKQRFKKKASVEDIPNYTMSQDPSINCGTCEFYGSSTEMGTGMCNKYMADVKEAMVCESWSADRAMSKAANINRFLMGVGR